MLCPALPARNVQKVRKGKGFDNFSCARYLAAAWCQEEGAHSVCYVKGEKYLMLEEVFAI